MKIEKKPTPALYPVPTVLVTAVGSDGKPNIITLAWVGVVNSEPPMASVSIRPNRHSYKLIKESGEFVINIPRASYVKEVDICGIVSGQKEDKFSLTGFTPLPASKVKAPLIKECPINLECITRQVVNLGSHDLFIGEIVTTHYDQDVLGERQTFDPAKADLLAYIDGGYWTIKEQVGFYGFSTKK